MKNGYIVTYDISNTKMRTKVFESLKDFGLKHIQGSVFWGMIRTAEKNAIGKLLKESCGENDRALIWPVSINDIQNSIVVNYPEDTFKIEDYFVC